MATKLISRKRKLVLALDRVLYALEDLSFDEKRKALRWVCDEFMIAPDRLGTP